METIKLGLVDDHNLFREGIKSLLKKMKQIALVLEAVNGQDLFIKLNDTHPDIILLDLEMDKMNGIDTITHLKTSHPDIKIIILTMHKEERMISYLMEMGANGYLLKDTNQKELEEAIHAVYNKGFYFNNYVSEALLKGLKSKTHHPPLIGKDYQLTNRELEVLNLIKEELTTAEIGERLFLSTRTIEGHRKNLLFKLDVKNTAGLMIKAIQEKIIEL